MKTVSKHIGFIALFFIKKRKKKKRVYIKVGVWAPCQKNTNRKWKKIEKIKNPPIDQKCRYE
jgi:hypothetical protein